MQGIMTTGTFAQSLKPINKRFFGQGYEDIELMYTQMFKEESMSDAYDQFTTYAGLGAAQRKDEAGSINYDGAAQLYTSRFTAATFALGFMATKNMMRDDKILKFVERKSEELGRAVQVCKEQLGASIYNNAFNAGAAYLGGDGKPLCSATHPTSAVAPVLNNTYAVDFGEAALEQQVIDMMSWKNNRGIFMKVVPKKLVLPTALAMEYRRVLRNDDQPYTADRNPSALRQAGLLQDAPVVNPYLVDTNAYFILTSEQDKGNGLIYFNRQDPELEMSDDFDTKAAKFSVDFRCVFGWLDPRCISGSAGAS